MCIEFDGHHSGGSSFVYVNDIFDSLIKKTGKESKFIWFRAPKPVQIRQSGRTGN